MTPFLWRSIQIVPNSAICSVFASAQGVFVLVHDWLLKISWFCLNNYPPLWKINRRFWIESSHWILNLQSGCVSLSSLITQQIIQELVDFIQFIKNENSRIYDIDNDGFVSNGELYQVNISWGLRINLKFGSWSILRTNIR